MVVMDAQQVITAITKVSVPKLSAESGVSTKTIYRIRGGVGSTTVRTIELLAKGLGRLGVVIDGHSTSSSATSEDEGAVR